MNSKPFLVSTATESFRDYLESVGEPAFRAKQITDWIYKKLEISPDAMLNVPKKLRQRLAEDFLCESMKISDTREAGDGTKKLLFELHDGENIESVIIPSPKRVTFCLSTQVGCPVRCRFCASGSTGLTRNLSSGEILEQFFLTCRELGSVPDNVVMMGIGEGLLNFTNLVEALEIISGTDKVAFAARRITISTSGWVSGIRKLADLKRQWNLAVSIHAADDQLRGTLIPPKYRCSLKEIKEACIYFREVTGRMVTFEYTLLSNVNTSGNDAARLADLAKDCRAKINLIPYNAAGNSSFDRPHPKEIREFQQALEKFGCQVTVRVEKGSDVAAACGQLRAEKKK